MARSMSNNDLFQKVRDLRLPIGKYALFGSAALGIRGWKQCRDIDIIVTEDAWNGFKKRGWEVKRMSHGSQYFCKDKIEVWKDWYPGEWNIAKLINEAEIIDGLPFVRIESVLTSKKLSNRKKDQEDIKLIERFLHNTMKKRNLQKSLQEGALIHANRDLNLAGEWFSLDNEI